MTNALDTWELVMMSTPWTINVAGISYGAMAMIGLFQFGYVTVFLARAMQILLSRMRHYSKDTAFIPAIVGALGGLGYVLIPSLVSGMTIRLISMSVLKIVIPGIIVVGSISLSELPKDNQKITEYNGLELGHAKLECFKLKLGGYLITFRSTQHIDEAFQRKGAINVTIYPGDITEPRKKLQIVGTTHKYFPAHPLDAIVNAANPQLKRGLGVCGAIFGKAGNGLDRECKEMPYLEGMKNRRVKCEVGDAVRTGSYGLNGVCNSIIHGVGPDFCGLDTDARIQEGLHHLENVYQRCFEVFKKKSSNKSIAFVLISSGIYRGKVRWDLIARTGIIEIFEEAMRCSLDKHCRMQSIHLIISKDKWKDFERLFEEVFNDLVHEWTKKYANQAGVEANDTNVGQEDNETDIHDSNEDSNSETDEFFPDVALESS